MTDPKALPSDPDGLCGMYRTLCAQRRILVVVDNARDSAQVRPLLPGAAGCRAVVTSRSQLAGLVVSEGARVLRLEFLHSRNRRLRRIADDEQRLRDAALTRLDARPRDTANGERLDPRVGRGFGSKHAERNGELPPAGVDDGQIGASRQCS